MSIVDTHDTVLRDRNHPSIILWSAGNEIHDTPQTFLANRILSALVKTFHEADPTRPQRLARLRRRPGRPAREVYTHCEEADLVLSFRISGPGVIVATDDAYNAGHDPCQSPPAEPSRAEPSSCSAPPPPLPPPPAPTQTTPRNF